VSCLRFAMQAAVRRTGLCHGVVLWMDWSLDQDGRFLLSTGPEGGKPTYWKQGVKLLRCPVEVGVEGVQRQSHLPPPAFPNAPAASSHVKVAGHFDSCNGNLKITVSFG